MEPLMKTLVAVYRTLREADHAVTALRGEAIADDRISMVTRRPHDDGEQLASTTGDQREAGAATTTVLGGVMAGLAALMIPYLGPVLAIGPLGLAAAAGTTTAAQRRGLLPSLVSAGVPPDDARSYMGAVRDGRALVMTTVEDDELEPAIKALARWDPLQVVQHAARADGSIGIARAASV
jgi:hypothetical protein